MTKRSAILLLAAVLLLAVCAVPTFAAEGEEPPPAAEGEPAEAEEYITFTRSMIKIPANGKTGGEEVPWDPETLAGKTVSILGDSISTYRNISNRQGSRWSNTTIGKGWAYRDYSDKKAKMKAKDTWWAQMAEDLGLRLLVNNSWSGSTFFKPLAKTKGAYVSRCVQLHDDTGINAGAEPDIVIVFLGENDFNSHRDTLGTAQIDYDALITTEENGKTSYREPESSLEAAAICLDKISRRYPLAEVYLMELPMRGDLKSETLEIFKQFNQGLGAVAEHFGVTLIPTFDGPITAETAGYYYFDGSIHPNKRGMDVLTEAAKKAILEHTAWKTDVCYHVSWELTGVNSDYGTQSRLVRENTPFTGKLTPAEKGRAFTVQVTMNGEDITAEVYKNGVVTIPAVTGEVKIIASAA